MPIKLTDAAKFFKEKQHQIYALNWLETKFQSMFLKSLPANTALIFPQNQHSTTHGKEYRQQEGTLELSFQRLWLLSGR
jgi:hypothetical protein